MKFDAEPSPQPCPPRRQHDRLRLCCARFVHIREVTGSAAWIFPVHCAIRHAGDEGNVGEANGTPPREPLRAATPSPRTSPKGLDRSDREIDIGYCCVTARRSIVFIGQSDFSGAGRSKDRRNDLACNALVVGAHSHHSDEVHFEREIFHGGGQSGPGERGRANYKWLGSQATLGRLMPHNHMR